MSLWELAAGEAAYPYHWHVHDEEVVVVLDHGLSLRGTELPHGQVVAFSVGEAGAHQLWNRGESPARFLSISSGPSGGHDIVFYLDSDKVGIYAEDLCELYRRDGAVDYWDGETAVSVRARHLRIAPEVIGPVLVESLAA